MYFSKFRVFQGVLATNVLFVLSQVKLRAAAARWKGDLSDPVQVLLKAWDERAPLTKATPLSRWEGRPEPVEKHPKTRERRREKNNSNKR